MSQLVLKREHDYIDTVGYGLETPAKVLFEQYSLFSGLMNVER